MPETYRKLDLDISCIVDILDCVLVPGWGLEQIISVQRNHESEMGHGSSSTLTISPKQNHFSFHSLHLEYSSNFNFVSKS